MLQRLSSSWSVFRVDAQKAPNETKEKFIVSVQPATNEAAMLTTQYPHNEQ